MKITKHVLKKLPKVVGDEERMQQMEYVHSVIGGKDKFDAFKTHFPDDYKKAVDDAGGKDNLIKAKVRSAIGTLERKVSVKQMYELAHKHAWTEFLAKKHRLYENLYGMAMDEENSVRDRIASSKTLLDHMPKFEEDKTIKVEINDGKKTFMEELRAMQIELHKQANKNIEEVIDVEAEDNDS